MAKRKNQYKPGMAQIKFKPSFDWEIKEARVLFENSEHDVPVDEISFEDCIKGMQSLPESSVDLVIADPPFGIDFNGKGSQYNRNTEFVADGYQDIDGDYDEFTCKWTAEIPRIMKDTSSAYIFSGWTNVVDVLNALKRSNLTVLNHIIWKYQFGVFTRKKFVSSHYHVLFVVKDEKKYFFNKIEHYPEDVWDIPRKYRPGQKKNSTKLPEALVTRCINFSSKPGDLVFDPFMGNGTTAVCAKLNYRHYFGYEKNEKMREILENNINAVKPGEGYKPYHTFLPSLEELADKYPHVKKYLAEQEKKGD
ncbi:MAG: DNA-methyltransferase [Candidatus Hodarchaeota archaeon]